MSQIIAISGSCSPVTDRRIGFALQHKFQEVALDTSIACEAGGNSTDAVECAAKAWRAGASAILHTSRGLSDPRYLRIKKAHPGSLVVSRRLGDLLPRALEQLLHQTRAPRAVVCGGDTSMHIARALGIEALEYLSPMAPGSPLCRVRASGRIADGCEIVFKGGQVGRDRCFLDVLNGGPLDP